MQTATVMSAISQSHSFHAKRVTTFYILEIKINYKLSQICKNFLKPPG